jgi:hypothetical protein
MGKMGAMELANGLVLNNSLVSNNQEISEFGWHIIEKRRDEIYMCCVKQK